MGRIKHIQWLSVREGHSESGAVLRVIAEDSPGFEYWTHWISGITEEQKNINVDMDAHSIRPDVYVKDDKETVYGIEVQVSDTKKPVSYTHLTLPTIHG